MGVVAYYHVKKMAHAQLCYNAWRYWYTIKLYLAAWGSP